METNTDYHFKELESHIIGSYTTSNWFNFVMHSDRAPMEGETVLLDDSVYVVEQVIDITSDDEREQGLSYSRVYLIT